MEKQTLEAICNKIEVWGDWRSNYAKYVPLFIKEAARAVRWEDWDQEVFHEYFIKSSGQCVSSLKQGYFTNDEKEAIKTHWDEIAPLLQKIAQEQHEPQYEVYNELKARIRRYTDQDRRAATNRLIAGLQPQLLCTIVNQNRLWELFVQLRINTYGFALEWKPSWFENSYQILQLFKKALNTNDGYQIMTYPWQVYEEYDFENSVKTPDNDMSEDKTAEIIALLKYKKQIILQGPPGTGKTKLAKKIAQVLTSANTTEVLTKEDIIANCRDQISIPTAKTKLNFKILGVNEGGIRVENSEGKEHTAPYNEIVRMYEAKAWEKEGMIVNGTHSYSAAVAKFLHSRRDTASFGYYKIIQFHPSYSYEDFVRGIVAESKGDKIEYKNVNKPLALFAEEALKNFQNSKKIPELISKEIWVEKQYQKFKELLESDLEKFEEVLIKNETKPKITAIEDDAIRVNRYSNESDSVLIKDNDIINGYIGLYLTSPQIKIKENIVLSKSARSGMYYLYQNLTEKFKKYLQDNNLSFDPETNIEKQELNNYVLIIDEINRANLSSVLGELIYALEYRNEVVDSIYEVDGSTKLILPPNLYIIGTMNTADRSVGHIDYAIRRRFAFVNVLPEALEEDEEIYFNAAHFAKVAALFNRNNVSPEFEAKDVQLGHSYFIVKKQDAPSAAERDELFRLKMAYEVVPLLLEYVKDGILTGKIGEQDIKDYINGLKPDVS
ncbi:AAA family ATPase [uncultured Chitinophaga sp.]|jgi:MoxR-like ATPases|uniref:AAA family ATPase n=1 Tax=uncultured Chitinophaga sp. TaxID=339340 RepID=UPI00262BE975|nr:AAA family ATPase [uncultured Chitinophaga sp.]